MTALVTADSVSKQFRLPRGGRGTLKEWLLGGSWSQRSNGHWALRDVSFAVEPGQVLGVIGHNGAGKTTLLRLLCGLGRPTSGSLRCRAAVSGLLELGGGFHPDLSGRENLITGGILSGFTEREVRERADEIIAFAELEEVIDQPARTYSTGMYLRLAFATAMHFDPEVLIIDEVLAVGDARFQQKCLDRLRAFRAANKTLILTSHVAEQIQALCDEVLVLEEGAVVMRGDPDSALRCYQDLMRQRTARRAARVVRSRAVTLPQQGNREGTFEAVIAAIRLYDAQRRPCHVLASGEALTIELAYQLTEGVGDFAVSLGVFHQRTKCFEVIVPAAATAFGPLARQGVIRCHLPQLPLARGRYFINAGLYPPNWDFVYDYHSEMHDFDVVTGPGGSFEVTGILAVTPEWSRSPVE
ncbi:MAG: ABC transporter ATP-binding protein [Deltaproteobacteria bacterium]|nr:ABC transporter ATP-binding protein [Deltaproteobacteria bacterium]